MSSQLWSRFRKLRAIIFALSTLLSIAWTVIFTILLIREWNAYNVGQRAIVIALLSINGVSSILMYLMIVVRFTLWIDAARITLILFFQLGGTITFALSSPAFPCNNVGSARDCKNVTSAAIMGGWTLSGLLLVYAFLLAVMSYIPPPSPPRNPEEALSASARERSLLNHSPTPSINSETYLLKSDEKHRSLDTTSSYSHGPHTPLASLALPNRSLSRPASPALSHASSFSSTWSRGSYSQSPVGSPRYLHAQLYPQQVLPNPFTDPIPRHTSPLSQASVYSFRSDGSHNRSEHHVQFPRNLVLGSSLPPTHHVGSTFPPPPYVEGRPIPHQSPHSFTPPFTPNSPGHLAVPGTPISLRPAVQANVPLRKHTASPGFQSVHSMAASMYSPSRSASFSTSRVPSPALGLPSSPRPVAFPPTPTTPVAQIRRFGSESNIRFEAQHQGSRAPSLDLPKALVVAPPSGQPNWVAAKSDRNVDFKQWKEAVLGAAAWGQVGR